MSDRFPGYDFNTIWDLYHMAIPWSKAIINGALIAPLVFFLGALLLHMQQERRQKRRMRRYN